MLVWATQVHNCHLPHDLAFCAIAYVYRKWHIYVCVCVYEDLSIIERVKEGKYDWYT
jgi:hypothetical protein